MKHYYQTDNYSCVQASAAMLLSAFHIEKTPSDVLAEVPTRSWPGKDEIAGTPNQDIGAYFCKQGLKTEIISFDIWVTDLSWEGKDTQYIEARLRAASGKLTAPMIGRDGAELYIQAYLDYIAAGGKLSVQPAPTNKLLKELLRDGPFIASVAYDTLHGVGKSINGPDLHQSRQDDINGKAANHNIVVNRLVGGQFEVYDPWRKPGIHLVDPDRLIAAISTAQQECDNMLIVARPKN